MTLPQFLHARIDEDELAARALANATRVRPADEPSAGFAARFDPARVLAECDAKRRIIDLAYEATGYDMTVDLERSSSARADSALAFVGDRILKALALPYADHPDFDEAWRI